EPIGRAAEGRDEAVYVPRLAQARGRLALMTGDYEAAAEWFRSDVREGPMAGSLITARVLPGLAAALRHLGRADEAAATAERALTTARQLGVPYLVADAFEEQAHQAAPTDPDTAERLHRESLATRFEHGVRTFLVDNLDALAGLAARAGRHAEAARLLAASDAARAAIGYPRPAID